MTKKTEAEFAAKLATELATELRRLIPGLGRFDLERISAEAVLKSYDAAHRPDVTLTLTADEADTLLLVMNNIGGSPEKSRRRRTDSIGRKLRALGARAPSPDTEGYDLDPKRNALYFVPSA